MALSCESTVSSISLCKKNSLTGSNVSFFASHKLPDGVVLDLCPTVADSESFMSSSSCKYIELEVLELERKLIGNGAHRELKTFLTARQENFKECQLVIVERLSAGVFADMFELQGLVARAAYDDALIYGDHNLERPAVDSSESMVVVHKKANKKAQDLLQAQFSIPLHARYPALSSESHVTIEIRFPAVLFQCSRSDENASLSPAEAVDDSFTKMPWLLVTMKNSSMLDSIELQWLVPTGDPQQADFVAFITALFSIIGVMALWIVSMYSYGRKIT